jgi:hypothetical protein
VTATPPTRVHDEEMPPAFDVEMAHGGQGLHALAQAHLVAEHRPFLAKRELRAEGLVPAQGRSHQGQVQRVLMDATRYLGGDEPLPGFDVGREFADLDEQAVVEDSVFFVVLPQGSLVRLRHIESRERLTEPGIQSRLAYRTHQDFELAERVPALFALTGAGKEHPQAAGRAP